MRAAKVAGLVALGLAWAGPALAQTASPPAATACDAPRASDRVMLVIGNAGYPPDEWPALPNAASDALAICKAFAAQGFRVIKLENAGRAQTEAAIRSFSELAAKADTAIFYFAGHGFEYAGTNFLVPIDAPLQSNRAALPQRYIDLAGALRAVMKARHAMVFLDACRTRDPVVSVSDADPRGPDGPVGTINLPGNFEGVVFYSTARGRPAFDAAPADQKNSPFAEAVIARLETPNLELNRYFAFVRSDVKERTTFETGGPQVPTPYGVLAEDYFFQRAATPAVGAAEAAEAAPVQAAESRIAVRASGPSAARFPVGMKFPADAKVTLVAGDTLTVLTSDGTRVLRGPGTFALSAPRSAAPTALARVMASTATKRARTGAVRNGEDGASGVSGNPTFGASKLPQARSASIPAIGGIVGTRPTSIANPAARFAAFDPGLARSALAALTPEQLRREDEPQIIGRVLGKASAGSVARLAESGDGMAQYLYGSMLYQGIGVPKDLPAARAMLARAAQGGTPAAQLEYGYFLDNFASQPGDKALALEMYEAAVKQGWPKAQSFLAYRLWSAEPPEQDKPRALALWRAAAAGGHSYAWYALSVYGRQVEEARAGLAALAAAGDVSGDAWACEADYFESNAAGARAKPSLDRCLRAAQEGYAGPMAVLAQIYGTGQMGPASAKEARYWARLADSKPELAPGYRAALQSLLKPSGSKN